MVEDHRSTKETIKDLWVLEHSQYSEDREMYPYHVSLLEECIEINITDSLYNHRQGNKWQVIFVGTYKDCHEQCKIHIKHKKINDKGVFALDSATPPVFNKAQWQHLCKLEPRLIDLLNEARQVQDNKTANSFCANRHWYKKDGLKDKLCQLVGWEARHPMLKTAEAYNFVYEKIYDVLPPCRDCLCM